MDGVKSFQKHFKLPANEIKKIRKEYQDTRDAKKVQIEQEKVDPDKFKCFKDMAAKVFDFYEELSGRKTNREFIDAHLNYYFDEGFEPEDCIEYIRAQRSTPYFVENPEWFTIPRLFPIKDQDRINIVWDLLAYYQSLRGEVLKTIVDAYFVHLRCGHVVSRKTYRENECCCLECILSGNRVEIARYPYRAEIPDNFKEFAEFFKRIPDETFDNYQIRTIPEFKKLTEQYGNYGYEIKQL